MGLFTEGGLTLAWPVWADALPLSWSWELSAGLSPPFRLCWTSSWWRKHPTCGVGEEQRLPPSTSTFLFFSQKRCFYPCSGGRWSLEMLTRRFVLIWPTSCLQKNNNNKTPASWNHALVLKKKNPHDSSCVKSMSHTYISTSSLWCPTSRLGDHYLSTRLLTLLFQHFQKFARKCLPVPGSP